MGNGAFDGRAKPFLGAWSQAASGDPSSRIQGRAGSDDRRCNVKIDFTDGNTRIGEAAYAWVLMNGANGALYAAPSLTRSGRGGPAPPAGGREGVSPLSRCPVPVARPPSRDAPGKDAPTSG